MREFFRATWLPTALFTAATLPLYLGNRHCSPTLSLGPAITAVILVPAAWYWYVTRSGSSRIGRAALAGASAAYVIATLSYVVLGVRFSLTHSWSQLELGALAVGLTDLLTIAGGLLIGAPIGASLGILVALAQRTHYFGASSHVEDRAKAWRSALTAIMIAILLSPLLAYLALASSQEALASLSRKYSIGYSVALAATWLASIPLAALLGARRVASTLFTRRTWVPTIALLAPAIAVGSMYGGRWAVCSGVTTAVLAPLIWSEVMSRGGHTLILGGAAAGAATAFLAQLVPAGIAMWWLRVLDTTAPAGGGGHSGPTGPAVLSLLLTAPLAALLGAAIGAVVSRHLPAFAAPALVATSPPAGARP